MDGYNNYSFKTTLFLIIFIIKWEFIIIGRENTERKKHRDRKTLHFFRRQELYYYVEVLKKPVPHLTNLHLY